MYLSKKMLHYLRFPSLTLGLATSSILISAISAKAQFKICNKTDSQIITAVVFKENQRWVASGWWSLDPEECETVIGGDLRNRYYYVHGHTPNRDKVWGDKVSFCVSRKAFNSLLDGNCSDSEKFSEVDTEDYQSFTWNLTCSNCNEGKGFGLDGFELPQGNLVRLCNYLRSEQTVTTTISFPGISDQRRTIIPNSCLVVGLGRGTGRARIRGTTPNGTQWNSSIPVKARQETMYTRFSFR